MSRITYQSYTNTALSANGIANDVAYAGGGYALSAAGPSDSLGHLITILGNAVTNHSAKTFTITGTDADDRPLTEGIAGPNGNVTVTSTKYFKTVTSVTVSATTGADTFDIGWTAAAVGAAINPDHDRSPVLNGEIFCLVASGSPTYSVQYTADATPTGPITTSWLDHVMLSGKTVTADAPLTTPVLALRLKMIAAGGVNLTLIEPFHA